MQLYSFGLDCTIRTWDWEAGKLLKTYTVGFPIDRWLKGPDSKSVIIVTKSTHNGGESVCTDDKQSVTTR